MRPQNPVPEFRKLKIRKGHVKPSRAFEDPGAGKKAMENSDLRSFRFSIRGNPAA
jgi:hypothetical protein